MNNMDIFKEQLAEQNPQAILFDDLDDCIVGYGQQYTRQPLAIYSHRRLLEHFIRGGMSFEEAQEWIDYNIACLWAGEGTPIILYDLEEEEPEEETPEPHPGRRYCRHCGVRSAERPLVDCPKCGEVVCLRCEKDHPCDYYHHIYREGGTDEEWEARQTDERAH